MVNIRNSELQLWTSSVLCLVCTSLAFDPLDNYLIDCGSFADTSVGNRVFVADNSSSNKPSSPQNISVSTSLNSVPPGNDSRLYRTARIFTGLSNYTFSIKKQGRHFIRLHFYPFVNETYNMSTAQFSVSTQSFTLIKEYKPKNGSFIKEYSLNVTTDRLTLSFTPFENSFAFISALEVISLPDELIPPSANTLAPQVTPQNLERQALETVARVNMGGKTVSSQDDTLWRRWLSDDPYLKHNGLGKVVLNTTVVNFTEQVTEDTAPRDVYGSATILNSDPDPHTNANVTWIFNVDSGFEYLVRFHFCDILRNVQQLVFNVYINSWFAIQDFDLHKLPSLVAGNPYYMDFIASVSDSSVLHISIGPSSLVEQYPNAILNGLEIMKINNSRGSFDVLDSISRKSSKTKLGLTVGLAVGSFIIVVLVLVIFLLCRRRNKLAHIGHSKVDEEFATKARGNSHYTNGTAIFSSSKIGYRFPFVAIQEATDNFSEGLVIGVGGFGKVYTGVLRDGTKVAVKRGASESHQGLAEFRTEIEMLSQFRHRHLVSLIGYCDERNEMIIIYEYMENGTLKEHLYGTKFPSLSWRQRLEICIGAARGLHYLHTGSTRAIIHRDVKSANILLDENLMAKVADFGLSKTGPDLDQTHVSTAVKGSFGYLDPEYLTRQQLTERSDVYSFGVVMFEVLCGRPVIDPSLPRGKVNLIEWSMKCQKSGRLEDIVDPTIISQTKPDSLQKFGEIADKCLAECGIDRPSMGDILWNLECALQLQGSEEKSSTEGEMVSSNNPVNRLQSQTSFSTTEFSVASVGDLAGASMSKVFAQMVREEMR
ncbi:putative Receptor-like kinase, partial [Melia azedarach]